jgi:glucose dehydrogenase
MGLTLLTAMLGAVHRLIIIIWGRIEEGTAYWHGIDRLTVGLALLLPVIARSADSR